ncbi:FecCD family ABC transporter permease [Paenibacillus senegalensis]|uniref:FecCD family ABC transporter permease n=1 Tax=Paenibacillus senegalensis TaxID=1465766 RepID=UPI000287BF17|nr:iron ABC transporter permease [Paenibacillus senegalensis]
MPKRFTRKFSIKPQILLLYAVSVALVLTAAFFAVTFSSVHVPLTQIVRILVAKITGEIDIGEIPRTVQAMIWDIRVPRVVLAFLIGSALALSGAAFQGLLRNPLADPYTIGVSSGSALGAVSVIFFKISLFGAFTLPLFGIAGGFIALLIVFGMTRLSGRGLAVETIILAGIIVSSFIGSFISLIIALSGEDLKNIMYWLMGSVANRGWSYVQLFIPFFLAGSVLLLIHHRELNALALGEQSAHHLGVNVQRKKTLILIGASLLTGGAVSVSGTIGFVGLVIPHFVRIFVGPNHRHLLVLAMLWGGAFLVMADLLARTVISPQELPIGIITALAGAPVFAFLLMRERLAKRSLGRRSVKGIE